MLSAVRKLIACGLFLASAAASAKDIHVLILGDVSAASCNEHLFGPSNGVFVLEPNGTESPARDPIVGADCRAGSIWMPLASRLKGRPGVDRVVLVPIAINDVKADDWTNGAAAGRLASTLAKTRERGITIDYALWQQGVADKTTPAGLYFEQVRRVVRRTTLENDVTKWLFATPPECPNRVLSPAKEAQHLFSKQVIMNRFPGADSTGLSAGEIRADCTLTAAGQQTMADRWFRAIEGADKSSNRYQKESLLYFFR